MKELIKENRADHIIQHAQEVFFTKGYSRTTISDICKMANCSRTTLYSYFDSKENIYLAVVKKAFQQFLKHFSQLEIQAKSGLDRVLIISVGYIQFSKAAPQYYQVVLDFYGILRNLNADTPQTEASLKIKEGSYFESVKEISQLPIQLLLGEIKNGQKDKSINKNYTANEHMVNIWAFLKGISDIAPIADNIGLRKRKKDNTAATVRRILTTLLENN
ncbi:MAG: TetR/AcrR family transcriptional regulator [Bacteroidota bacterium]